MANTSVTYAGTGAQVNFTVPFPFISRSHVKVFVNGAEVLQPSIWYWVSDSQITFRNAPTSGAGIVIRRVTPGDTRLVDFQNGAVLTEADLDLSANQIFYLAQEAKENYAELVNNELTRIATAEGIVETDPDLMIASLVDTMLADAAANTLQAAVGDIALNGEVILDIQTKLDGSIEVIDLIGAFNGTQTAFLLDTTKVKLGTLDTDPTFATTLTTLEAADSANSASITTISTVTIPGIESDVTALGARYGVTLNVNGYITGFAINAGAESGTFVVLADKFAVVDPSGDPGETEFVPFSVAGGVVTMQNVQINGNLVVDGTITNTQLGSKAATELSFTTNTASTEIVTENSWTAIDSVTVTTAATDAVEVNAIIGGFTNNTYGTGGNLQYRIRRFSGATPIQILGGTDQQWHDETGDRWERDWQRTGVRFETPGAGTWTYKVEFYVPSAMSGTYFVNDHQMMVKVFKKST
jgi:hypothetical protein